MSDFWFSKDLMLFTQSKNVNSHKKLFGGKHKIYIKKNYFFGA